VKGEGRKNEVVRSKSPDSKRTGNDSRGKLGEVGTKGGDHHLEKGEDKTKSFDTANKILWSDSQGDLVPKRRSPSGLCEVSQKRIGEDPRYHSSLQIRIK